MIDFIWDYINHCFDEEGYIPNFHETLDALDHILTGEEVDRIEEITLRFIAIHDMTGIQNKFEGENEMNYVHEGASTDVVIEENGFHYRTKQELIEAIRTNPEEFAEMLLENKIAEYKEVV